MVQGGPPAMMAQQQQQQQQQMFQQGQPGVQVAAGKKQIVYLAYRGEWVQLIRLFHLEYCSHSFI